MTDYIFFGDSFNRAIFSSGLDRIAAEGPMLMVEWDDEDVGPADREDPDESDQDADDGDEIAETEPCPYCGKPLYEQAELCPHCGSYLLIEDAPRRYPLWIAIGIVAALVAVLLWVL